MGIIKNWSTTYPGAIDVVTVGGSMAAAIDGVDEVIANHVNSLAAAVVALETENVALKAGAVSVPLDGEQVGTSFKYIGSIKIIKAGVSPSVKVLIGCIDTTKSATLEIRRFTTGATIVSIGGVAGGLTERTASSVTFAAIDWYGLYLKGSDGSAVAICKGCNIALPV